MASDRVKRPASHQLAAGPAKRRIVTRSSTTSPSLEEPAEPAESELGPIPNLSGRRVTRSIAKALESRGIDPAELEEPHAAPWARLPVEIQRMILKAVAEIVPERPYFRRHFIANKYQSLNKHISNREDLWMLRKPKARVTTRSVLATVSRQWQGFFEEINFSHLILHQDDLSRFETVTQTQLHRRQFIQAIYLRLELNEYSCGRCSTEEDKNEQAKNMATIQTAVEGLFKILSKWDPAECYPGGLTLEMSAHSHSDAKCFARELYNRIADNTHDSFRYKPSSWYAARTFSDSYYTTSTHGWWSGSRHFTGFSFDRRMTMARRVFAYSKTYIFQERLPVVRCVSNFLIRRQFYRDLGYQALRKIVSSLRNLVSFRYESWGAVSADTQAIQSYDFALFLRDIVCQHPTLRRVSLYGSTSPVYHFDWNMYDGSQMPIGAVKGNILDASRMLAWLEQMDEIHGGRSICAEGFFYAYRPCDLVILDLTMEAARYNNALEPKEQGSTAAGDAAAVAGPVEEAGSEASTVVSAPTMPKWPNLTHLSLSTTFLNKAGRQLNWLLTAAGRAAKEMPKLKMMELWNYDPHSRALFSYTSNQGGAECGIPRVELYTSWPARHQSHGHVTNDKEPKRAMLISNGTKKAWNEAVKVHCQDNEHRQFVVVDEYVWDHSGDWGPCVIKHLKMRDRIVTPVSLEQMELEGWAAPT